MLVNFFGSHQPSEKNMFATASKRAVHHDDDDDDGPNLSQITKISWSRSLFCCFLINLLSKAINVHKQRLPTAKMMIFISLFISQTMQGVLGDLSQDWPLMERNLPGVILHDKLMTDAALGNRPIKTEHSYSLASDGDSLPDSDISHHHKVDGKYLFLFYCMFINVGDCLAMMFFNYYCYYILLEFPYNFKKNVPRRQINKLFIKID